MIFYNNIALFSNSCVSCTEASEILNHRQTKMTWSIFRPSAHTALWTHIVWVMISSQLMLYRKIIAVCSELHTEA